MSNEEAEKMLSDVAAKLGEHFDAVQIMASWNEEGVSAAKYLGSGNWCARQGMAHEFINQDQAQIVGREVASAMPQPPEEETEV